ncbi:PREDICTED: insulin-like growth factor-binding protein 3 [Pygoscelis adeliae]|nr:PREDICTED: insulin-like growth factor-binding protein 3 [Pygoscelis adeliae]
MSIASSGYTKTTGTKMLTRIPPPPGVPPLFLCIGSATILPVLKYLESMGYVNMGFQCLFTAFVLLEGNSSDSEEEDQSTSSIENQAIPNSHRVPDSKSHPPHIKIDIIRKVQAKNTQRYKVEYDSQSTDTLNFSSESKQETEYGPCRREMEDTLNHLKILNVLSPRGFHIPNCDKKGFYKKKQCRPSKGRKRGYCWCVDKYGQPLPGYDGKGKGDVHCYNLESK